ncbi:MAG: hypothetical protein JWP39_1518 [Jatrophihabitans sp.]|jgi:hypothetical protein|nr:hypothetical protein [Jatrophihabitans sp.]
MNVTKDKRVIAPCSDYPGAERAVEDLSGRGFALKRDAPVADLAVELLSHVVPSRGRDQTGV